jgi:hypothetical protein
LDVDAYCFLATQNSRENALAKVVFREVTDLPNAFRDVLFIPVKHVLGFLSLLSKPVSISRTYLVRDVGNS